MCWLGASSPDLEFGWPTSVSLLGAFDLPLSNWALPSPGDMALLAARDIVEGCPVILLTTVLGAVAGCAAKAAPSHTPAVLCSVVILIAPEALCDIAAAIEQLTVMELTIHEKACID